MIVRRSNPLIPAVVIVALGCAAIAQAAARYPGPATAPAAAPTAPPIVLRVERFRVPGGLPPLPDVPAAEVRARGTRAMSVEATVVGTVPFHSAAAIADHTVELGGQSFPGTDGYYRVQFHFEDRGADGGSLGMSSSLMLKCGTTLVLGGFGPGGDGKGEVLLFTLEPAPGEQPAARAPTTSAAAATTSASTSAAAAP